MALKDQIIAELQKKTTEQASSLAELKQQLAEEAEVHELELEELRLQKDEVVQQMMNAAQVEEEDPLADLGLEEIKAQNRKLRSAITNLTFGFEEEKKKLDQQAKQETAKDAKIKQLEGRLQEMDFLLEEVTTKDQELAEMQEKLEEINEYETIVEEMVTEIAAKEEENEEMQRQLAECQEEQRLMEELNNQLEQYNKELQQEVDEKDLRIQEFKAEVDQLEMIVIEQDTLAEKYKDKQADLTQQVRLLNEQLQEYTQDGSKDQVRLLLDKQTQLIRQLRESEAKHLTVQRNQIEMWQGKAAADLVQRVLPEGLQKEA